LEVKAGGTQGGWKKFPLFGRKKTPKGVSLNNRNWLPVQIGKGVKVGVPKG